MGEASAQGTQRRHQLSLPCPLPPGNKAQPAGPTPRQASQRKLIWGPAQMRLPCPPLSVSAEIHSAFTPVISSGGTVSCEAASRVLDLAGQRGGEDTFPSARAAFLAPCHCLRGRAKAKIPIKTIALKPSPEVFLSDPFILWRTKLRALQVDARPTC